MSRYFIVPFVFDCVARQNQRFMIPNCDSISLSFLRFPSGMIMTERPSACRESAAVLLWAAISVGQIEDVLMAAAFGKKESA